MRSVNSCIVGAFVNNLLGLIVTPLIQLFSTCKVSVWKLTSCYHLLDMELSTNCKQFHHIQALHRKKEGELITISTFNMREVKKAQYLYWKDLISIEIATILSIAWFIQMELIQKKRVSIHFTLTQMQRFPTL